MFIKVLLMREIMRFGKRRKLFPRYIRLFEILERVREVAYKITLPPDFIRVHLTFICLC